MAESETSIRAGQGWTYLDTTGCFVWTGKTGRGGRPVVYRGGQQVPAARIQWQRLYGPLPDRVQLVSLCGRMDCVSPYHHVLRSPGRVLAARGLGRQAIGLMAATMRDMKRRAPTLPICWEGSLADVALPPDEAAALATAVKAETLLVHAAFSQLAQTASRTFDPAAARSAEERILGGIDALRTNLGLIGDPS